MARKYSVGQKKAYYSGMGYAMSTKNKRIRFRNRRNRASFLRGFNKGIKK